jgi:hypothetical protein
MRWLIFTTCPPYNILAWTAQRKPFLCCYSAIVSIETCLFAKPLLSNGSCIFAYLAVVAQQRVYMLQYINSTANKTLERISEVQPFLGYHWTHFGYGQINSVFGRNGVLPYRALVGRGARSHCRHFAVRQLPRMDVALHMYLSNTCRVPEKSVIYKAKKKKKFWFNEMYEEMDNHAQYFSIHSFNSFQSLIDSHLLVEMHEFI